MKNLKVLALLAVVALISACGSSSSSTPTAAAGTESATQTASVTNTVATNAVVNAFALGTEANAQVLSAQTLAGFKAISIADCTWYDTNDDVLDMSTPATIQAHIAEAVSVSCAEGCTGGGTQTFTMSNGEGTPFFTEAGAPNTIIIATLFESCPMTNDCGTNTIDGTLTVTASGLSSDPCDATLTIESDDMTIDSGSTSATVDMTIVLTATGDCSEVDDVVCETDLSSDSTISYGATTYDKDDICDMIDNPTCT